MKKRRFLPGYFLAITLSALSADAEGSPNLPEDPYSPELVLASPAAKSTEVSPAPAFLLLNQDTVPPIEDRPGDFISNPNSNPFDLKDPAAVEQNVEYDPISGQYIITERIGDDYFRPPTYMTFDEFMEYQARQQERQYFDELIGVGGGESSTGRRDPVAKVDVKNKLIDRIFGGSEVDINPQGNIDLTFGVQFNNVQNPSYTRRQQRQGGFDFDMGIQMNVDGKIGEKLKLNTNYNTQATFDFDNTMKLDYNTDAFGEDDIIKKIEAGNVSLPLRSTLIQGSQSLFGLKLETQWGKLRLTGVASQQKSEREEITLKGGSQFQEYEVFADAYDENRHFFLTHYNRNNFEESLSEIPVISTLFKIQKIQVWVTDTRNATENIRDIVAIADLGETARTTNTSPDMQPPVVPLYRDNDMEGLPDNYANPIFPTLLADPRTKQVDKVTNVLRTPPFNFQQGRDFEKATARLLSPTEFTYHPQLGFVSLNVNIQPDQVVGVAFEYTYLDSVYQVGQIAEDVPQNADSTTQNVLFVKMLKGTIQPVELPTWDLMMKNVYNIGAYNVSREDFKLDIFYEDPGNGKKRFLPTSSIASKPLLRVFNLDQLNVQNDPQPDGVFDYVDGLTINSRNGRIMFPVLEPFGSALEKQFTGPTAQADAAKYVYKQLYNQTLFNAREYAEFNRFTIEGSYKSSVSSEISLGAFNIPQGTVIVYAGGQKLKEGTDYEVDYSIGKVRILNDAYLNSGAPIRVEFEDNTLFGFQTKTMLGLRADYDVNEHLSIGGTYLRLFERPFTQKVNIGDDPINNRIFGLDMNYSNELPWLTKAIDFLPLISTKAPSSITFSAETAALKPGHARAINEESADEDKGGVVYIDDFEGSAQPLNVQSPYIGTNGWVMASVPQGQEGLSNPMFPESVLKNNLLSGVNRAHLSWYRVELDGSLRAANDDRNPYTVNVEQQEIFPNFTPTSQFTNSFVQILDLAYDPTRRGPYNFDPPQGSQYSAGINSDGQLNNPKSRWGGIMRQLTTNDFQSSNIEFVEFWLLSPFLDTTGAVAANPDATGGAMDGDLYINFGNVSEDIMPDSRKFFENGLPGPNTKGRRSTTTAWGQVPLSQQITNAFDIDPENRLAQDVGLDGLPDSLEREHFMDYLNALAPALAPVAYQAIFEDPSNDNFKHFRSYPSGTHLLDRFDRNFGTEGNTPENTGQSYVTSSTSQPDAEDLDGDRTLNETESYFQYRIPIEHDGSGGIRTDNNPYITERVEGGDNRLWYRFRVPLEQALGENFQKIGGIQDFRSIRFMRMYLKDFEKPVKLRFATLDLVRNQWRRYRQDLGEPCFAIDDPDAQSVTAFDLNKVNIEENSQRTPFNYVVPPGISREQALGVNINALQNEQSLSLEVCDLEDGDAKGIFKNVNLDMRYFSKMKMFVHAEENDCGMGPVPLQDGELTAFIRIGSDFKNNFYEYEIPLKISTNPDLINPGEPEYPRIVWPEENDFNIDFELLKQAKIERNASDFSLGEIYELPTGDPDVPGARIRIKGNPNLGLVKAVMVGVRNPKQGINCDPGDKKSVEIWINELRVFGLDERGGVAATAKMDLQMADFATVSLSGKTSSIGFGALDQQLAERSREQIIQYDLATQVQLDKFLPQKIGLKVPFYFQLSNETRNPQFDPYDLDIELKDKLRASDPADRDSIRQAAQYVTKIKSYNFTNVRKERTNPDKKPMPWDVANFSFTYAYDETHRRDPIIESDKLTRQRGAIDYTYSRQVKYVEPFKKLIKNDKYLKFIKDVNFNPFPNSFSVTTDLDRRFNTTKYRFAGDDPQYSTYYNKQFLWGRQYDLQWDFTRNLKFKFNANNNSIIDEPDETLLQQRNRLDPSDPFYVGDVAQYRRDSTWANIKNLGRTKGYSHNYTVTYNVPLKSLPFMDWTSVKLSWDANYAWDASSLTPKARALGNIIRNGQNRQLDADLDFEKLYNYVPYLKKINSKQRPPSGGSSKDGGRGGKNGADEKEEGGAGGLSDGKGDKKAGGGKLPRKERKKQGKDAGNGAGSDGGDVAAGADGKGGAPGARRAGPKDDDKKKGDGQPSTLERALIRPLMVVRKFRFKYAENYATVVPGYMPDSKLLGMSPGFGSPGWDFVAGLQPNMRPQDYYTKNDWLYTHYKWITPDVSAALPSSASTSNGGSTSAFSSGLGSGLGTGTSNLGTTGTRASQGNSSLPTQGSITQSVEQNIEGRLTLEPFADFRVDVEAKRSKSQFHAEEFRRFNDLGGTPGNYFQDEWRHANITDFGQFNVTYSALKTLFDDDLTGLFKRFDNNRVIIANRLGALPPGSHENTDPSYDQYPKGYGPFQQNVLLPAFIAAYTGQDPNTMKVSNNYIGDVVLKTMPKPNWRLTYNGLSKVGFFKDVFQSITINHGYVGRLIVSSFDTDRQFDQFDPEKVKEPNLDYYSRFEIPDIQIDEQFNPLFGFDVRLKNDMSFKAEYKSSRTLRLELLGTSRLHETRAEDLTIGFGYKIKEAKLGFLTPKKKKGKTKKDEDKKSPLGGNRPGGRSNQYDTGDMDFTFDFSLRDDITTIHELVTDLEEPSRGNRTLTINPQILYQLNEKLSLRFFFDYRKTTPKTSQGFPTTNVRSGVTVRFSL